MIGSRVIVGQIETRQGTFGALLGPQGLARLTFPGEGLGPCRDCANRWWPETAVAEDDGSLDPFADQLQTYFAGELRQFALPLDLRGTPFQLQVWAALQTVPFGHTQSYAWLASAIGRPRAVRAVGRANGANPVPIIVPCHRVIGSDGTLVGYGGGLELKRRLLALEGRAPGC